MVKCFYYFGRWTLDNKLEKAYHLMEEYFIPRDIAAASSDNPKLFFIFGAPGTGKSSTLKPMLNKMYENDKLIHLEVDDLKLFIPKGYDVAHVADAWVGRILNTILQKKLSVVIYRQRNLLQLSQTKQILQNAKQNGYTTFVDFLALDKVRSRLNMAKRYENNLNTLPPNQQLNQDLYLRKPSYVRHYIFYKAIPMVAKICTRLDTVDVINVYDQNARLLLNYAKNSSETAKPAEVILQERNRPLSQQEKEKFNQEKEIVLNNMKKRGVASYKTFFYEMLFRKR